MLLKCRGQIRTLLHGSEDLFVVRRGIAKTCCVGSVNCSDSWPLERFDIFGRQYCAIDLAPAGFGEQHGNIKVALLRMSIQDAVKVSFGHTSNKDLSA